MKQAVTALGPVMFWAATALGRRRPQLLLCAAGAAGAACVMLGSSSQ